MLDVVSETSLVHEKKAIAALGTSRCFGDIENLGPQKDSEV